MGDENKFMGRERSCVDLRFIRNPTTYLSTISNGKKKQSKKKR